MIKAYASFRIGTGWWMDEGAFEALLDLFTRYPGVTDDLIFFTSITHAPLPLREMLYRMDILRVRMQEVRQHGLGVGVNILATLGHHEENLTDSLQDGYSFMTGLDGAVCRGTLCPSSRSTYSYVAEVYRMLALSGPDHIWIDDDIRLFGHMPITAGCFCDTCLQAFTDESGTQHSRESLRDAFNCGMSEDRLKVRREWLDHNRRCVRYLLAHIEQTVHSIDPEVPLGFMSGDRFYEGYDFGCWADALSGQDGAKVFWRPGGGFYNDTLLSALTWKSHEIGRQVSMLPESVLRIQSEIENFPYQSLKKGPGVTALEAASHIAAGCTGTTFNVLPLKPPVDLRDPFREHEPIVSRLAGARPFYDKMVTIFRRSGPQGIYTGWNSSSYAVCGMSGDWFEGNAGELAGGFANELLETGIPAAYHPDFATVTLLCGDAVLALDEEQILRALSSGVYMDADALKHLNTLGFEDLTGLEVERYIAVDGIEELLDSPVNRNMAGMQRDCRQSFGWGKPAAALTVNNVGAQALARLVDYAGREVASCCMAIFENRLGGRICVSGYYPWSFLQDIHKVSQIKSLMRWLSADKLPAYVASFHRVNCWVRETLGGTPAVVVINASIDAACGMVLAIRSGLKSMRVCNMDGVESDARLLGTDGSYQLFELPEVGPWEMRLVW